MIILPAKIRLHLEQRAIEWGMAGWSITWGLQVLLNPEVFTSEVTGPLNVHMLHTLSWVFDLWTSFYILGGAAVVIGLIRLTALSINGAWKQTPLIRMVLSAASAFLVSNIVVSLMQGPPTLGLITYSWLFLADCFSGFRAARDYKLLKKV